LGTINFDKDEYVDHGLGREYKRQAVRFFKPIGYYQRNGTIKIIAEFEPAFESLKDKKLITSSILVESMSLRENAVIAAFSMDSTILALEIFNDLNEKDFEDEFKNGLVIPAKFKRGGCDKKIIVNGYNAELIMGHSGFPQFFLDDKYNLHEPICAYVMNNNRLRVDPIIKL